MTTETAQPNVLHCKATGLAHVLCVRKGTPDDEVEAWINRQDPTGISSPWAISSEIDRVQCEDFEDREHLVVNC